MFLLFIFLFDNDKESLDKISVSIAWYDAHWVAKLGPYHSWCNDGTTPYAEHSCDPVVEVFGYHA